MSLETPSDLQRLRDAFGDPGSGEPPPGACPAAETIFTAANGGLAKMTAAEQGELLDHLASCPACGEAWRLAVEIGKEVAAPAAAPVIAGRFGGPPSPLRRALPIASLVAALLLIAIAVPMLLPDRYSAPQPGMRGAGETAIVDLSGPLDRQRCVLRWRLEPERQGALFAVRVMSETLEVVASPSGLAAAELEIPPAKLLAIPPGGKLLWQVQASLPDGSVEDSPTFASPLP